MNAIVLLLGLGLVGSSSVESSRALDEAAVLRRDAESAWQQRALGFREHGRPDAEPVRRAIDAWTRALELDPEHLPTRFALIEALYFDGHFVEGDDSDAGRARFEQQLDLALETRELIARPLGGWETLETLDVAAQADRLRDLPDTVEGGTMEGGTVEGPVEAEFWSAISWGLWGMSHSKLAAARRGVANRIREHATLLAELDPAYADGAADRLLGRLHTATPKVPLITGWLDRQVGIDLLRRANAASTRDGRNPLFLAEALLRHRPRQRTEALRLLREVACRRPDPRQLVEESETIEAARAALRAENEAPGCSTIGATAP